MKKIFLVSALGVMSSLSANNLSNVKVGNNAQISFKSEITPLGYCSIDVYRVNADGSSTFIGSWGGYASSQEACNAKGNSIITQLNMGIAPENVVS